MNEMPFKTTEVQGDCNVMTVPDSITVKEVHFNRLSREIHIVYTDEPKYTVEELESLSWQAVKKLVEAEDGTWTNKAEGIEFLTN
jgi:hypothetical protein